MFIVVVKRNIEIPICYFSKYSIVTPKDLYTSLDKVVDKKSLPENVNLTTVFENWTNQAGYPVITVTKNRTGENASIIITQKPFYLVESNEEENKNWYIPLNYVQETENIYFNNTSVKLWLIPDGNESSIEIKENIEKEGWIIFNVQQTGKYYTKNDCINISFLFGVLILLYVLISIKDIIVSITIWKHGAILLNT